jgi:hypothetical protein
VDVDGGQVAASDLGLDHDDVTRVDADDVERLVLEARHPRPQAMAHVRSAVQGVEPRARAIDRSHAERDGGDDSRGLRGPEAIERGELLRPRARQPRDAADGGQHVVRDRRGVATGTPRCRGSRRATRRR